MKYSNIVKIRNLKLLITAEKNTKIYKYKFYPSVLFRGWVRFSIYKIKKFKFCLVYLGLTYLRKYNSQIRAK